MHLADARICAARPSSASRYNSDLYNLIFFSCHQSHKHIIYDNSKIFMRINHYLGAGGPQAIMFSNIKGLAE